MCVSRIDSGVCLCVLMKGEGNKKMYSPCFFVCVILELDIIMCETVVVFATNVHIHVCVHNYMCV